MHHYNIRCNYCSHHFYEFPLHFFVHSNEIRLLCSDYCLEGFRHRVWGEFSIGIDLVEVCVNKIVKSDFLRGKDTLPESLTTTLPEDIRDFLQFVMNSRACVRGLLRPGHCPCPDSDCFDWFQFHRNS